MSIDDDTAETIRQTVREALREELDQLLEEYDGPDSDPAQDGTADVEELQEKVADLRDEIEQLQNSTDHTDTDIRGYQ